TAQPPEQGPALVRAALVEDDLGDIVARRVAPGIAHLHRSDRRELAGGGEPQLTGEIEHLLLEHDDRPLRRHAYDPAAELAVAGVRDDQIPARRVSKLDLGERSPELARPQCGDR